jgi:hypothetical protein
MNYSLLETQGYITIPNFLTLEEIEYLKEDYTHGSHSEIKRHDIVKASDDVLLLLKNKINPVLTSIKEQTTLDVDFQIPWAMYWNPAKAPLYVWHTDVLFYFLLQQNRNFLNFYIPVIKPNSNKSGLSIIPLDKLVACAPEYADRLINIGANRFFPTGDKTNVVDLDTGNDFVLPINIDSIAVTPETNPGDLLLMRGDVIHRTEEPETERVAISMRFTQGSGIINKTKFLSGPQRKRDMLDNEPDINLKLLEMFKTQENVTAQEFYEA